MNLKTTSSNFKCERWQEAALAIAELVALLPDNEISEGFACHLVADRKASGVTGCKALDSILSEFEKWSTRLVGQASAKIKECIQLVAECGRCRKADRIQCGYCCDAVLEELTVLLALRGMPAYKEADIMGRVMAALPERRERATFIWSALWARPLARAAAIALVIGGAIAVWRFSGTDGAGKATPIRLAQSMTEPTHTPPSGERVVAAAAEKRADTDEVSPSGRRSVESVAQSAAQWLAAQQRMDGSWDVEATGGRREHAAALTGLGLMALGEEDAEAYGAELERGAKALVAMQNADGSIGAGGEFMMYNHGIATVALLKLRAAGVRMEADDAIVRAVEFTRQAQQPEGGWGYQPGLAGGAANTSTTAWQIEALGLARRAGEGDPGGHLRRGLFWLSRLTDTRGVVGYHQAGDKPSSQITTTALGLYCLMNAGEGYKGFGQTPSRMARQLKRMLEDPTLLATENPYRDYFVSRASAAYAASPGKKIKPDAEAVKTRLIERGVVQADASLAWDASDAYGQVGGMVYSTSLSAMALH